MYINASILCLVYAGKAVIYQPAASLITNRGFALGQEGLKGKGQEGGEEDERPTGAGLCVRVDDSAWSRALNIAVQGAGGPFQVSLLRPIDYMFSCRVSMLFFHILYAVFSMTYFVSATHVIYSSL